MIERYICFCKECGYISIEMESNTCRVCNSKLEKTDESLQSLLNKYRGNPLELSSFFASLFDKCDKAAKKSNHKAVKQHWSSFFSKESQVKLKQSILICDSCGHITGTSCLFDDNHECCICKSHYNKAKVSTLDYFMRRETYMLPAIEAYENKLRKKTCSSITESAVLEREKIESVYLPAHIESSRFNNEPPSPLQGGVIPAIINMPRETKTAAVAIWDLFIVFLSCISSCEDAVRNGNSQAQIWITELLTNTFNVLRCEGFTGQQKAANIIMTIITDMAKLM